LQVYGQDYILLSDYVDGVDQSWSRLGLNASMDHKPVQPFVYIASDSPAALSEFAESFAPNVFTLSASKREELRALASPRDYYQKEFMELEDPDVRLQATRGMVVDFAVLSGAWAQEGDIVPDAIVCAVRQAQVISLVRIRTLIFCLQLGRVQTLCGCIGLGTRIWRHG
jgi:hypothetical protein